MFIVIFVTVKNKREGKKIARCLVEKKLAACVNVTEGLDSIYRWKNKVETAKEVLLVIKTQKKLFLKVRSAILNLHSYDVPEIIALSIVAGHNPYLNWIKAST